MVLVWGLEGVERVLAYDQDQQAATGKECKARSN
jgi:hypothetical protein